MGTPWLDIPVKAKLCEISGAANDFYNGLSDIIKKIENNEQPDLSPLTQLLGSVATYASYFFKNYANELGVAGAFFTLFNLEDDNDKLREAINKNDTENTIIYGLSVVSDVANIIAAIPIPQVKAAAIALSASATLIKMAYIKREKIARFLKPLSDELALFTKRLKYDPSIYLNLPNSAIRCHVVNGLNMNRGFVHHGAYSQNRLQPHPWGTTNNQRRAPTQHPLTANEMRIKQQLISNLQEHPYTYQVFEWKKPGVFELRTNRKY